MTKVRRHWETAAACDYAVNVSRGGKEWYQVPRTNSSAGPRIDDIDLPAAEIDQLRIELKKRANPAWGFSLYEVQVVGQTPTR